MIGRRLFTAIAAAGVVCLAAGTSAQAQQIVIGSKGFTEQLRPSYSGTRSLPTAPSARSTPTRSSC